MKLYRIYTENKNLKGIKALLNHDIESYTLLQGVGIWCKKEEKCLIIEIISEIDEKYFEMIASGIKELNNQQAVLLTVSGIESKLF